MFTIPANTSPVGASAAVVIDRPAQAVFCFIGDRFFVNYPRWSPEVRELKKIGSGPVRFGTRARQVRVDHGHRSESIFAVTVFDPGRRIRFEGISRAYRCDYEINESGCEIVSRVCFTFELPPLEIYWLPFEGLIRKVVRDGVERTVLRLKHLIEAEGMPQVA